MWLRPEPFSLFTVNWPYDEYGSAQWAVWLTWDIGSVAAYESGAVGVATFLYHFSGDSFDCDSMAMGSMFQNTLSQLANWMAVTTGASVADAVNPNACLSCSCVSLPRKSPPSCGAAFCRRLSASTANLVSTE